MLTCQTVYAKMNYLHTVTLEKSNNGYNIVLGTDTIPKITKRTPSNNELILELSSIKSDDTVNAMYKGTNAIDNLVIENAGFGKLKIYVNAENIKNAQVSMLPASGEKSVMTNTFPTDKVLWGLLILLAVGTLIKVSHAINEEDNKLVIKRDIKDREIELYRKYRKDLEDHTIPFQNMKIKGMMKKIDRKIDERLSASIK